MISRLTKTHWVLLAIMACSLVVHVILISRLNIVEDESGYMQDAAQIRFDVLPFREFGGTKGPLFLVLLKLWQEILGPTLESSRLFSVVAHVASIPLLYVFTRNITTSQLTAYGAAFLWALVPVVVSLTSNVMHIPFELLLIISGITLLSRPGPLSRSAVIVSAAFFFAALLTRATAVAFFPLFMVLLALKQGFWKSVLFFGTTCACLLLATVALIYPLYGWPKTAFFFNADATLISGKQRALTAVTDSNMGMVESMFRAALPAWREGLLLMLAAYTLPFLWMAQKSRPLALLTWGGLLWFLVPYILEDIVDWWPREQFMVQWTVAHVTVFALIGISFWGIWQTQRLPRISNHVILILLAWVSGFVLFYKGYGRTPTPYYVLESIPAFAIAASVTAMCLWERIRQQKSFLTMILTTMVIGGIIVSLGAPYPVMLKQQYRGTVAVAAAKEMADHIRNTVPDGEPLFTAQPVFAYLSEHPLYGRYTHPGWYLSERAGYLPAEIRRVFLPDFDVLISDVKRDVHWIVLDWRTGDVYFNDGWDATAPLRDMLEQEFTPVVTVKNPASRDITLYRRTTYQPPKAK